MTTSTPHSLKNASADWLGQHETTGYSRRTVELYKHAVFSLDRHLTANRHDATSHGINASHLDDWKRGLLRAGLANATVDAYVRAVRTLFRWLFSSGRIFTNPADGLTGVKVGLALGACPTEADMRRLLDSIDGSDGVCQRDRALLEVAYSTGARLDELSRLNLSSSTTDGLRILGKGGHERVVPLTSTAIRALEIYLRDGRPRLLRHHHDNHEAALFLSATNGVWMSSQAISLVVKRRAAACGLRITTHAIRRAFGAGDFVKDGKGYLSFSRYAKTLTGSVSINEGVLDVSAPAALAAVSEINVAQGGQLRLATNGTGVSYAFGGPINLGSTQRATGTDLILGRGFGILGGLRYDPASGVHSATISSAIVVTAAADIHVNGADKTLTLAGAFSGSGDLTRTGGGTVVFTGTASGYTGDITLDNGITLIGTGATLGSGIDITVNNGASLGGGGSVGGGVTYEDGSFADFDLAGGNQTLAVSGGVTVASGDTLTIRGANASGGRTVTIAAGSISASGATITAPGSASVVVGATSIVVTY